MSDTRFRCTVTNEQIAKDLGISNSMVSRIRSGDRLPSIALMRKIAELYDWPASWQLKVFSKPAYARGFEVAVDDHYSSTEEGQP